MNIETYRKNLAETLSPRSLCFLYRKDEILLGYKKQGFGKGNWLGIGGKKEQHESIEETTIRETEEEVGVTPINLQKIAELDFYFPYAENPSDWNQSASVFRADQWQGNIVESEEIKPRWFATDAIPYDNMWSDARLWMPNLIAGIGFTATFLFDKNLNVQEYEILPWPVIE